MAIVVGILALGVPEIGAISVRKMAFCEPEGHNIRSAPILYSVINFFSILSLIPSLLKANVYKYQLDSFSSIWFLSSGSVTSSATILVDFWT